MDCIYINLESKADRRLSIESNFEAVKKDGYTIRRLNAINVENVVKNGVKGNLRDTEKACFLSHKAALKLSLETDTHSLIMEDDALLSKSTFDSLENLIKSNSKLEWDIIYLEACIPEVVTMLKLVTLKNSLKRNNSPTVMIDLRQFNYAGATAYVVNKKSKQKIHNMVDKIKLLDVPYDIVLREMLQDHRFFAYVAFPFLSSFSNTAFDSDIRLDYEKMTDLAWILFRKLMWQDSDVEKDAELYKKLREALTTPESDAFATIVSASVSEKFVAK